MQFTLLLLLFATYDVPVAPVVRKPAEAGSVSCPKSPIEKTKEEMKQLLDKVVPSYGRWARVGSRTRFFFFSDDGSYQFRVQGLPPGASFDPITGRFLWIPSPLQTGEFTLLVTVYRGKISLSRPLKIQVWGEEESYFLPAFKASLFFPNNVKDHGLFYGTTISLTGFSWIKRTESSGPSHGRIYAFIESLESLKSGVGGTINYGVGIDLSLEKNPRRYWFIPSFGLELGGSWSEHIIASCLDDSCATKSGGDFVITPLFGLIIYNRSPLWITLSMGYHIPVAEWHTFRGYKITAGIHYGMW